MHANPPRIALSSMLGHAELPYGSSRAWLLCPTSASMALWAAYPPQQLDRELPAVAQVHGRRVLRLTQADRHDLCRIDPPTLTESHQHHRDLPRVQLARVEQRAACPLPVRLRVAIRSPSVRA